MCVLWLFVATSAYAQTKDAAKNADALNKLAVQAYQRADYNEAITQWLAAERIDPNWKYALNLAGTFDGLGRHQEAWAAAERAEARNIPSKHAPVLLDIKQRAEKALFPKYARLDSTKRTTSTTIRSPPERAIPRATPPGTTNSRANTTTDSSQATSCLGSAQRHRSLAPSC